MDSLMFAAYQALLWVPLLTLIPITPYVLFRYRRDKALTYAGCAFGYLLLCSILASFSMTMLPFPDIETVSALTGPAVQLLPFHYIYPLFSQAGRVITDWGIVLPTLRSHVFISALLNIVMLMPTGFLIRALSRCSAKRVMFIGLCISLAFELIQLSGLFFIYPRPYRLFDVDDLICNTLGAWIGGCIEPFFERFFPLRLQSTYRTRLGGEVSFARRLFADLIDYALVVLLALPGMAILGLELRHPLAAMKEATFLPRFFLAFFAASAVLAAAAYLCGGRSPGMRAFGFELRSTGRSRMTLWRCLLRSVIRDLDLLLPELIGWLLFAMDDYSGIWSICIALASAVCVICYAFILFSLFIHIVTHGEPLPFERISGLKLGLHPNARAERRLQIFYSDRLRPEVISGCTQAIFEFLLQQDFEQKKCMRVQYLAEGVLLEWMNNGLADAHFDLRYDRRFFRKALLLCAPGPQSSAALRGDDSYIDMLSGTRLSFDTYFTGDTNVFSIEIP